MKILKHFTPQFLPVAAKSERKRLICTNIMTMDDEETGVNKQPKQQRTEGEELHFNTFAALRRSLLCGERKR